MAIQEIENPCIIAVIDLKRELNCLIFSLEKCNVNMGFLNFFKELIQWFCILDSQNQF